MRRELRSRNVEVAAPQEAGSIDAIVIAGGDGTLVGEIPSALALDVPVGIVPLGTFNDLARTLEIPLDIESACDVIASAKARRIDVARVNGAYYVSEASIGISSRLARRQRSDEKQRFGLLAIVASALTAVRHARSFHAEISHGGTTERVHAVQLTVANSQRFGGFITVEGAAIDDGQLNLYAVDIHNARQLFSVLAAIVSGKQRSADGLRTYRAKAFDVWTRRPHHISADGEPAGKTPARFEVLPGALRVFAP
ncbi:MAG: YegS/Rv2252/BmrU family lipid kinase [Candidatus Eremiobacteraeota bacterium]|nr:YegS/Rv2252/BmrU family lipid kinase [Candidatus Eremiobacteraeota bacterium]